MIDVCQWRVSIGCWSCRRFHVDSSSSHFVQSSHNAASVNCFHGVVAGIICFSIALRFLLILSGDVELNPGPPALVSIVGPLTADDKLNLKKALQEGSIKTLITKAFMQGEARVGKSSLRCLLFSERYIDRSSTGCIEPPKVALFQYGYSDAWKHIDEDEMSRQVIAALQSISDIESIESEEQDGHEDYDKDYDEEYDEDIHTAGHEDIPTAVYEDISIAGHEDKITAMLKDFYNVCELRDDEEIQSSLTETNHWIYLIDSGGQLEFQKVLPAFMPCASVLIIVVSLAKNLSDPSCTTMNINDKEVENKSEYSLSVEEVLKKLASSVVSSTRHFASFIDNDIDLQNYIKPHFNALLNIIPVATHHDVYKEMIERGATMENSDEKVQKIREIFECHKSTCSFVTRDNEITLYEIDGRTATTADTGVVTGVVNPEIKNIYKALNDNAYKVDVPLRWYCLNILLQKLAEKGCGVLSLSDCIKLGKGLHMKEDEVVSALKFLHFLNKLLYYPNSEVCSDLVFVQMNSLIDITKELIQLIYEKHSDTSKLDFNTECLVTRGYLSVDILQKQSKNCAKISKYFDGFETKVLKLFQELLIAAPLLDQGQYFMPALLPVKNVSKVEPFPNMPPLLYYFKYAVPMGLFCAFIARLLSAKDSKLQWYIVEANWSHFSNYFTLKCHNLKNNFVLIEQLNCIEVHCDGTNPSNLALARDDITKAIMEAITSHSLGENVIPQEAFYCPCGNEQKHILLITKSITGEHLFTCTKDPTKHIDDDKSWIVWLDISKNDEGQMTDSDTSTGVDELSLDDHNEVFGLLNNSITKWDVLGLNLGIRYTELEKIQTDCKDTDSCLMKMLAAWLKQSSGKGPPTYKQLVEALKSMGEATSANKIKRSLSKRKGSKSDASASKRQCM